MLSSIDPCLNETAGYYKLENFCRSYWECVAADQTLTRGISQAHCCPVNQTFSKDGKCVDDPNCDNPEECTVLAKDAIVSGKSLSLSLKKNVSFIHSPLLFIFLSFSLVIKKKVI